MKRTFKNVLGLSFAALLAVSSGSCTKEQVSNKETTEQTANAEISTLKAYMSKLVNVPATEIQFKEEKQVFTMFGVDQISKKDLAEAYYYSKKQQL
nr:hypothetical protein [Pedobacter panaciterrae]